MKCVWETKNTAFEFKIEDVWCEQLMPNAKELLECLKFTKEKGE